MKEAEFKAFEASVRHSFYIHHDVGVAQHYFPRPLACREYLHHASCSRQGYRSQAQGNRCHLSAEEGRHY
jgi:hypothetical protein